ncbi:Protein MEI2-like 3 [Ceratobasidium theobromae]|uniref:Protein MEI2-like 3 n=1 Tax=Ceratobasidium theobromae TaxID=1582974 RepID=A0A5N5QTK2_9AGAM|nr:Protein MEI2-like 3 [Ceratobasidium theobromae]
MAEKGRQHHLEVLLRSSVIAEATPMSLLSMPPYWSPPESHAMVYYPYVYSPPPAFHSQLQPQAAPFVPKGLPRLSAPEPANLARVLRSGMPPIRSRTRQAPEAMDASNISDKFIHVEGVPRNASSDALRTAFERCGLLKGIFVRLLAEHGVVLLAFYDSRHASSALAHMQENPYDYFDGASIAARMLPGSRALTDSDSRVYIHLVGHTTALGPQMQNLLSTFGDLKSFRVVGMHYKLFHAEFFDSRESTTAIFSLNNHKYHGAILHLSMQPDANVVPTFSDGPEASDRKPDGAYIPFPSDGHDDSPATGLFDHRARFGRRASTGSAFPSPDSRRSDSSANQSTDHLPGAEGVHTDYDAQDPLPHARRRSVAHSFDSASVSSATSLRLKDTIFPLSPDRTASTAPSTPAAMGRKMSLPPFQGPLPPPATNQWTSASTERDDSEKGDLDGFIPVRASARSVSSLGGASAHMCLPASARAVLDLLRDPPPERNRVDIARIEAGSDTRTTIMLKNAHSEQDEHKESRRLYRGGHTARNRLFVSSVRLPFPFRYHPNTRTGSTLQTSATSDTLLYVKHPSPATRLTPVQVNFIHVSDLLKFMQVRLGKKWNMYASEKVLGAGYANYQGKEALVDPRGVLASFILRAQTLGCLNHFRSGMGFGVCAGGPPTAHQAAYTPKCTTTTITTTSIIKSETKTPPFRTSPTTAVYESNHASRTADTPPGPLSTDLPTYLAGLTSF